MSLTTSQVTQSTSLLVSSTVLASGQLFAFDSSFTHAVIVNSGTSALKAGPVSGGTSLGTVQSGTAVLPLTNGSIWLASLGDGCPVTVTPATEGRYTRAAASYSIYPDGTDCGAKINVALQAMKADLTTGGRGALTFAAGTYRIGDADIELPANIEISGAGGGLNATILKAKPLATVTDALVKSEGWGTAAFRSGAGVRGTSIRNITIDGNRTGQLTSALYRGVAILGYDFTLEGMRVINCPLDGLITQHNSTAVQQNISPVNNCEFGTNGGWGWLNMGPHDNKGRGNRFYNNGSPQSVSTAIGNGWKSSRGGYFAATLQSPVARVAVKSNGLIDGICAQGKDYRYHTILTWQSGDAPGGWAAAVVVAGAIVGWLLPTGAQFPASLSGGSAWTVKAMCGANTGSGFAATITTDASGVPTLVISNQGTLYGDGPLATVTGGGFIPGTHQPATYIMEVEGDRITRCIPTLGPTLQAVTGGDGVTRGGNGTGYNTDPTAPVLCAITGGAGSGAYATCTVTGAAVTGMYTGSSGYFVNHQNCDVGSLVATLSGVGSGTGADVSIGTLTDHGAVTTWTINGLAAGAAGRGSGYTPTPTSNQSTTVQGLAVISCPGVGVANSGLNGSMGDPTGTILTDCHSWGDQTYGYLLLGGTYLYGCTMELGGSAAVKILGRDCAIKGGRAYSNGFIRNPWFAVGVGGLTGITPGGVGIMIGDGTYGPKDVTIQGVSFSNFHKGAIVIAGSGGGVTIDRCTHRLAAGLRWDFGYTNTAWKTWTDLTVQYDVKSAEIVVDASGNLGTVPEIQSRGGNLVKRMVGNETVSLPTNWSSTYSIDAGTAPRFQVTGANGTGTANTGSIAIKPASAGDFSIWLGDGFSSRHRFMPSGQIRFGRLAGAGGNDPTASFTGVTSSATLDANATDTRGGLTVVSSGSPAVAGATIVTVAFRSTYGIIPYVIVQGRDLASQALNPYANTTSTANFTIATGVAPAASTSYSFTYWVMG